MKQYNACLIVALLLCFHHAYAESSRMRIRLDDDWRFTLGDPKGVEKTGFDDAAWRIVNLPHDWSIEGRIARDAPSGWMGGYFPCGTGWYRHGIGVPPEWKDKRISIEFEGVYMNAEVYLNGLKLGYQPYGYSTFFVDLTAALKAGTNNVLALRVDNSRQPNSRWYSGSGIYRHVWLHVTEPVCVAPWGVFAVTHSADPQQATMSVETCVRNDGGTPVSATVETTLLGPDGKVLATGVTGRIGIVRFGSARTEQELTVPKPPLWSPEEPKMCVIRTRVRIGEKVVDEVTTPIGIRHLAWSSEKGMTINGKTVKLRGGCIHHDNGVLGACAFDRAEERKIEKLKAGGFNAIRTAHNPPSPALLDACDRLGMLVMDEAFDCWFKGKNPYDYSQFFSEWWQRDLSAMVLRDRNHPSVVFWSIGNEVPNIYSALCAEYGCRLADFVRTFDRSRPVTNGILAWPVASKTPKPEDAEKRAFADLQWDALDIIGSNYTLQEHVEEHGRHPQRVLVSTESRIAPTGVAHLVMGNSFAVGDFVWAAQDYLGERGIGRWDFGETSGGSGKQKRDKIYPWHGVNCGILDLLGAPKPAAHWRNVVWNQEKLALAVRQPDPAKTLVVTPWGWFPAWESWTWPGMEGKPLTAEVHARYKAVRLYLNGKLFVERSSNGAGQIDANIEVPYSPGILRAVGVEEGREVEERKLETCGEPVALRLTPDRTTIHADGQGLSFVSVEAVDERGRVQPNAGHRVTFTLSGPGEIAGLGSANLNNEEPYRGTECRLFHGTALVVVRSSRREGEIHLRAEAAGIRSAEISVLSQSK